MTDAAKQEQVIPVEQEIAGYAWNFTADLGNGRQFSLTGNFPRGATADIMSKEVDKVRAVFDRQQAMSASRGVEEQIEQLELKKAAAVKDMVAIDAKNAEKKTGLSPAERQQREAAVAHLEKMDMDIEYRKGMLAKLKAEAK